MPTHRDRDPQLDQIVGEIHDDLLPPLFAARMLVQSLSGGPVAAESLEQLSGWLDQANRVGRRLLDFHTGIFMPGQRWSAAAAQSTRSLFDAMCRDGQPVEAVWQISDTADAVPDTVATVAHRIVCEAIRNALRHGRPSRIEIDASRESDELRITIRDDGCGFDPTAEPTGRHGQRLMRTRAASVGGHCQIRSRSGGPTTVTAALPMERAC